MKNIFLLLLFITSNLLFAQEYKKIIVPTACGSDNYEPNNDKNNYYHLSETRGNPINKSLTAKICPAGDFDYYSIVMPFKKNKIDINLTHLPKNYNLYLIRYCTDNNSPLNAKSEHPGTSDESISVIWNEGEGCYSGGNTIFIYVVGLNNVYDETNDYSLSVNVTEIPTDVGDNFDLQSMNFKIYPNPVNDNFKINYNTNLIGNGKINIFNAYGQTVYSTDVNSEENEITVNTQSFPSGVYWVQFSGGKSFILNKEIIIIK